MLKHLPARAPGLDSEYKLSSADDMKADIVDALVGLAREGITWAVN